MSRDSATGHAKELLLGHIKAIRALRDERREINAAIAERKKDAGDQGFDGKRIEDVVRWQEECEKHGRDKVDEAEALFELYRDAVDGQGKDFSEIMADARDRALLAKFAPQDQTAPKTPSRKEKAVADALAAAACSKAMRGGG